MIIIVESGATKTDWCAAALDKEPINVKTAGMNLATMPQDVIEGIVAEAMAEFKAKGLDSKVSEVHFYAAGLIVPEGEKVPPQAKGLDHVLRSLFPEAEMEYASDLLDAARAVCGHKPGVAAIMGTRLQQLSFRRDECGEERPLCRIHPRRRGRRREARQAFHGRFPQGTCAGAGRG